MCPAPKCLCVVKKEKKKKNCIAQFMVPLFAGDSFMLVLLATEQGHWLLELRVSGMKGGVCFVPYSGVQFPLAPFAETVLFPMGLSTFRCSFR